MQQPDENPHLHKINIAPQIRLRLYRSFYILKGSETVLAAAQAQHDVNQRAFRDMLQSTAEMLGVDPSTDFRFNLDEGWIEGPATGLDILVDHHG